jgi:hypothetical protein
MKRLILVSILALMLSATHSSAQAQIDRKRVSTSLPVEEVFLAPSVVTMSSVTNLPRHNMNVTIMHTFGLVSDGVSELFGLDAPANIRFGLDYGITDRLSVGVGRSRYDKLFDFRTKANVLRQTRDDRIPLEIAVKADVGIMTLKNGFDFSDRLSFLTAVLIARKFSESVSLQVTPMFSHFNTVFVLPDGPNGAVREENDLFAIGLALRIGLGRRVALLAEYIPVVGKRSDGTRDELAIALNLETGGHVFQLFVKTSQWLTEQHAIARNTDQFLSGDFRFGFNVNRFFGLDRE